MIQTSHERSLKIVKHPLRLAFTLIELLVVIAILAILIGLVSAAVQRAREAAARARCASNLKQLVLAVQMYHDQWGTLPPSRIDDCWATWAVLVLPYLEQTSAYNAWDLSLRYYQQTDAARLVNVSVFFCPTRRVQGAFSQANADARPLIPSFPQTPGECPTTPSAAAAVRATTRSWTPREPLSAPAPS